MWVSQKGEGFRWAKWEWLEEGGLVILMLRTLGFSVGVGHLRDGTERVPLRKKKMRRLRRW